MAGDAGASVGRHDDYGRQVLLRAAAGAARHDGPAVEIDYGAGHPARIDASIGDVAVEVESRVSKQVRGAVLDLLCHRHPKKLLVLLPVHMGNAAVTRDQCRHIMARFCPQGSFRVVVLQGSGDDLAHLDEDAETVAAALRELEP